MNKIIFLLLTFVIRQATTIFCSAACKPNSCTGPNSNQCTNCDSPYILSNTSCVIDTTSGYVQFATIADINSNLGSTTSCGSYSTYGPFYNGDVIRLNLKNSINFPHYSLRLIAWTFLQDAWTAGQVIKGTLSSTGQIVSQPAASYSTAQLVCGWSTTVDWYLKLDLQFSHTTTSNNDRIDITTTQTTSQPWGIKQIMILVGKCHTICLACTGATVNLCSACTTGYKLSGTTCNQSCLYKYGQTSDPSFCVGCDLYCTICYGISTNCSACQINGTYQSYLNGTTCLVDCPLFSTEYTLTHTCIPCNNTNCQNCTTNHPTNCTQCVSPGSYWFDFDCLLTCPNGYYANAPNCTQCDNSCLICTGSPSPCTQCRLGFYLYIDQCLNPCPTGYFQVEALRICLDCPTYCVRASLTMVLDPTNRKLITTINFNRRIDFTKFPMQTFQTISNDNQIPLSKFTITYTPIDQYSYKIQLVPIGLINMTATNFTVSINPKTQEYYSKDPYPFNDNVFTLQTWQVWSLIILPEMQQNQQLVIDIIEEINSKINLDLSGQFVQEIKKTGLFAFLFPGAQLSSIIVLHNSIPAQNFYQGSRFWASFIYFQVPKWEDGPNCTKYVVTQQVNNLKYINSRLLQLSSTVQNWRFYRTGFTNFFLFDTYLISALLLISWLIILIPKIFRSYLTTNRRSIFYNILHKIHQISLFYISMSVALEWLTLSQKISSSSTNLDYTYVYSSFGVSIAVCVYIMFYQVYVFYQLIPYCAVQIRSQKYMNYLQKYSYFLRDLRYQHYKSSKQFIQWTPRHMLRPYNYQILSCIRLILLVITPCIFHDYPLVSIAIIISIQISEILRFIFIWPYNSKWRNLTKLILQIILLILYIISMLTYFLIVYLYQNLNTASEQTVKLYFGLGWLGFSFVFLYNLLWIGYLIVDIVIGCRFTNKERMDASRNQYYTELLSEFERKNMKKIQKDTYQELRNHEKQQYDKSYKIMQRQLDLRANEKDKIRAQDQDSDQQDGNIINKIKKRKGKFLNFVETVHGVDDLDQGGLQEQDSKKFIRDLISKGNLNNIDQDQLKTISVVIEEYQVKYSLQQGKYSVKILRVPGVFLRNKISPNIEDNTLVPKRNTKQILLHDKLNFQYYRLIHNIFTLFASISTETVTIRTYLIVNQNLYAPTQEVPQIKQNLKQVIQIRDYNGNVQKQRLDDLLEGFPIPNQLLEKL